MITPPNKSELALMLTAIDQENEAAESGLYGLAAVGPHKIITARTERAWPYAERLIAEHGSVASKQLVEELMGRLEEGARKLCK